MQPQLQMKSVPTPPLMESHSATFAIVTPYTKDMSYGSQTLNGRIVANLMVESQEFADAGSPGGKLEKRMIHVDLKGSEFGGATNILDQNDLRGFYVEWIEYKMWLQASGAPDPASAVDTWAIFAEAPDTANASGSVTSAISWGFNANAGVFGDVPTGGLGGNIGVSNSNSHTLTDFTFTQHSDSKVLFHKVQMSQTKDGTPYQSCVDLVNIWQSPLVGIRLRELPDLAKSNVPLVGQALWMNKSAAGIQPRLTVHIQIQPRWFLYEGYSDGFKPHGAGQEYAPLLRYEYPIDFSLLR